MADLNENKAVEELQAEIDKIDFDGDSAPTDDSTPVASTPDPEQVPVLKDDEVSTPEPVVADGEDTPDSTQDEPKGVEDDKPALIDSHYRAAQRMGMKPEEISELYDSSPALAAKTLAKCYEMVNAESQRLGKLGVAIKKSEQTQAQQPQQQQQQPVDDRVSRLVAKVKSHYGDDDPMAEVLTELLKDRQPAPQPQQQQRQEPEFPSRTVDEEIAARQQINTFFADPDLTAYEDLYGRNQSALGDWTHLTPGQRANRVEVCNRAQMLLYGAAAAGMEMGTAEALERAHLEIAAPMAEQIVRTRLVKSAKKREKGVTLVPGGNSAPVDSGGKYNHKQAVEEVATRMKEVFGS